MDENRNLILPQSQCLGNGLIEYFGHISNLNEVISRSNRSQLGPTPFHRLFRYTVGVCSFNTPLFLNVVEVFCRAETFFNCPLGPFFENSPLFLPTQFEIL